MMSYRQSSREPQENTQGVGEALPPGRKEENLCLHRRGGHVWNVILATPEESGVR